MNFIDEAYLEIKAGDGGSGASSFRREKYIPFGGPQLAQFTPEQQQAFETGREQFGARGLAGTPLAQGLVGSEAVAEAHVARVQGPRVASHDAQASAFQLVEVAAAKRVVWTFADKRRPGIDHFQILNTNGRPLPWPPLR